MHWHTAGPGACTNMHSPSEPTSTDTVQDQGGRGAGLVSGSILANRTWFPELMLLATAPPWPIPLRKDRFLRDGAPSGDSVGCPLPPLRFMWPLFPLTTTHRGEVGGEAQSGIQVS